MKSAAWGEREVLARLELPESLEESGYGTHPTLIDGALHSLIGVASIPAGNYLVPASIDRVIVLGAGGRELWAHGRLRSGAGEGFIGDIRIFGDSGRVVIEIQGLKCALLPHGRAPLATRLEGWCHERAWAPVTTPPASSDAPWLVISPKDFDGSPPCTVVSVSQWEASPSACLAKVGAQGPVRIADLRWLGEMDGGDPVSAATVATADLLATVQTIEDERVERYYLVSAGAHSLSPSEEPRLAVAPVFGLARTVMSERPGLCMTLVDLEHRPSSLDTLLDRLVGAGDEREAAYRQDTLHALRIRRGVMESAATVIPDQPAAQAPAYRIALTEAGSLDGLGFKSCGRPAPGPGEVEIEVDYASIHFKDVMKAMGLISQRVRANTYFGESMGMEGTGRVSRVGAGVSRMAVGDRVYAAGPFLQSHVLLEEDRVMSLPEGIDLAAGASVLALVTVFHAFVKVAHLSRGERVLIHSASGGVGLAAIEIARWCGAEIFATAGTEEKRAFLREHGIEHVADSRSVDFADAVMEWTDGRGVDVVLNFTPGEIMRKSVGCLAPFGRFLELGKIAVDRDDGLPLRPFNENLLFAAIDLDRILQTKPDYVRELFEVLFELIVKGEIKLPVYRAFPASQVGDAFRLMARAQHIGKLVVGVRDEALRLRADAPQRLFRGDTTYIVTGGLGGFGLELAQWLADHGARHLALISRSGPQAKGAVELLRAFEDRGVHACALAADVSRRGVLEAALAEVRGSMPPIAGVFHAAMVLDDLPLDRLSRATIERVMGPKAAGAWHLHELTSEDPIEHMMYFSSISSWVGNAGQGNYVAANAFLDQLAHLRRAQGLPALSVNWGVIGRVGVAARDAGLTGHLESLGLHPLAPEDALEVLGACLNVDVPELGIMDVNWRTFADVAPAWSREGRLAEVLVSADQTDATADGRLRLLQTTYESLDSEARRAHVEACLLQATAAAMRVADDAIDPTVPLGDLGMDSLLAMEIASAAEPAIGVKILAMELASGPATRELALRIAERIDRELDSTL